MLPFYQGVVLCCQYVTLLPGCGLMLSVHYPFTRVWSYTVSMLPIYQGVVLYCQYVTLLPGCDLILSVRYPFTRVWSYAVSTLPFYQGVILVTPRTFNIWSLVTSHFYRNYFIFYFFYFF